MRTPWLWPWLAIAASCGGGGNSTGASHPSSETFGVLSLLSSVPADGAVGVAANAVLEVLFDSPLASDSLGDPDTWLRVQGETTTVPMTWSLGEGGRRVSFRPTAALALEQDYVLQLSGLTCDVWGRLLDAEVQIRFRTVDTNPPVLLAVDQGQDPGARSRTAPIVLQFSEVLAPECLDAANLHLVDGFGTVYPAERVAAGAAVEFRPYADLPGDRTFTLTAGSGLRDRSGNALANPGTHGFRTVDDTDQPHVVTMWPLPGRTGISPHVQPTYTFDEAMDPASVEPASLRFEDQFGAMVAFAIHASPDQRTLRVRPLAPLIPGRHYTLTFVSGPAGATDVSGNPLASTQVLDFTTGTDASPPTLLASTPLAGEGRVSTNAVLELQWDEPLDPEWVHDRNVRLLAAGQELALVVELTAPDRLRATPVLLLPTATACRLVLAGGHAGLRDLAGNVLADDLGFEFTTSSDTRLPQALLMPPDGATAVPRGACVAVLFDVPMDPATLQGGAVAVTDDDGTTVPGQYLFGADDRTVHFAPAAPFAPSSYYRIRVRGGSAGPRTLAGSWLPGDRTARFRTGMDFDTTPPQVQARLNGIDETRSTGLLLPPHGFTIDVAVVDPVHHSLDMAGVDIVLTGPGMAPAADQLRRIAELDYGSCAVRLPPTLRLQPGNWTLQVRARDLSGNQATSAELAFVVAEPTAPMLPFERTQVVWVRTDLDRDRNGTPDFDDDLLRLGLAAPGDPCGSNVRLRELVLDGILAKANRLYGRGSRGEPLGGESVSLRLSRRLPIGAAHMQIALGGYDPEGRKTRTYGDDTTGVLGRAYYDHRNANMGDRNIATSPGLGVFPGEMWLYQTYLHQQVWPSFQTMFAQRFRPLCAPMGGTPAGAHALDAVVLAPGFDYAAGTGPQRARWLTIMQAADEWANVIGVVLAHEVGHAVGLVAPGPAPRGLFGDRSLHNAYATATEVMAAAVGYEAMATLDYAFRDIDLAYLRQRVLLR